MISDYFFVAYITTLIFVAGGYFFASRILENRLFVFISAGWLLNALYLVLEAIVHKQGHLLHPVMLLSLGLISTFFFHWGVLSSHKSRESPFPEKAFLSMLSVVIAGFVIFIGAATLGIRQEFAFFLAAWLPVIYTIYVLLAVSARFSVLFSEEDYGFLARVLYGSWALYALLQVLYPLRMVEHLQSFFGVLFVAAFALKLVGAAALLRLIQIVFSEVHARATHASVIAELGDLAAGIHHDISSPLGILDGALDELERDRGNDRVVQAFLRRIDAPLRTMEGALRMIDLARLDPDDVSENFGSVSIRAALNRALSLYKAQYAEERMRIIGPDPKGPNLYVSGNIDWLGQAFLNVIKNSVEAGSNRLWISLRKRDEVQVAFKNDGRPMTEEELARCRKPGWSSKMVGQDKSNVGMGLYMTSKIVLMHRGRLTIANRQDCRGVISVVFLPASRRRRE